MRVVSPTGWLDDALATSRCTLATRSKLVAGNVKVCGTVWLASIGNGGVSSTANALSRPSRISICACDEAAQLISALAEAMTTSIGSTNASSGEVTCTALTRIWPLPADCGDCCSLTTTLSTPGRFSRTVFFGNEYARLMPNTFSRVNWDEPSSTGPVASSWPRRARRWHRR